MATDPVSADLQHMVDYSEDLSGWDMERIKAAVNEIERLRFALERIAYMKGTVGTLEGATAGANFLQSIAHEALTHGR